MKLGSVRTLALFFFKMFWLFWFPWISIWILGSTGFFINKLTWTVSLPSWKISLLILCLPGNTILTSLLQDRWTYWKSLLHCLSLFIHLAFTLQQSFYLQISLKILAKVSNDSFVAKPSGCFLPLVLISLCLQNLTLLFILKL